MNICSITGLKISKIAGRAAVYVPSHPAANNRGYVLRYRYLMEKKLGRHLKPSEEVHHIDEDETNDDPGNLEVKSTAEHARLHRNCVLAPGDVRARKIKGKGPLDYRRIKELMDQGLGNRRISRLMNEPRGSIKYAIGLIRAGKGFD